MNDNHYKTLNDRFDLRAGELRALGYSYERITAMNIAVFTRTKHGKVHTIAAGTVLNADPIVWADTMLLAELYQ